MLWLPRDLCVFDISCVAMALCKSSPCIACGPRFVIQDRHVGSLKKFLESLICGLASVMLFDSLGYYGNELCACCCCCYYIYYPLFSSRSQVRLEQQFPNFSSHRALFRREIHHRVLLLPLCQRHLFLFLFQSLSGALGDAPRRTVWEPLG